MWRAPPTSGPRIKFKIFLKFYLFDSAFYFFLKFYLRVRCFCCFINGHGSPLEKFHMVMFQRYWGLLYQTVHIESSFAIFPRFFLFDSALWLFLKTRLRVKVTFKKLLLLHRSWKKPRKFGMLIYNRVWVMPCETMLLKAIWTPFVNWKVLTFLKFLDILLSLLFQWKL